MSSNDGMVMASMDDLVQFLRARLDEDEQTAKEVLWEGSGNTVSWSLPASATVEVGTDEFYAGDSTVARHIARHDPARVLAEVNAKRLLLADHPIEPETGERTIYQGKEIGGPYWEWGCAHCHVNRDGLVDGDGYCLTWRALALPYADHPDYRDEWRPTND